MMRIAFDASSMPARPAGAGRLMHELGHALAAFAADHPLLLLERYGMFDDLAGQPGVTLHRVPPVGRVLRAGWEQISLPRVVRHWGTDVLHGLHHSLPLMPAATANVVTVHDVTFDVLPRRYTASRRWYMRAITRLGLLRADAVIVPSSWVRSALVRRYGVRPERIHVVPLAPPASMAPVRDAGRLADVQVRYQLPNRFLLSVGTLEPGKNRETLLRALALIHRRGLRLRLVVVGQRGWLDDAGAHDKPPEQITYLGYVPDEDLPALYTRAEAFLFPSWLEGFGLPPLEALACATPVISSRRPAMTEVLGDAVLYADPRNPETWAESIERIADDLRLRESLIARGLERASSFSWERSARETLDVYAAALRLVLTPDPSPAEAGEGSPGGP
jgi:glycosyltransferase involved in cell wall biosynthesis